MAEQWTRKKPKRVLHNQKVIILWLAFSLPAAFAATGLLFWLISIYPATPAVLFSLWIVAATGYCVLAMLQRLNEKRLYK